MAATVETRPMVGEERFLLTDISWDFYLAIDKSGREGVWILDNRSGLSDHTQ